VNVDTKILKTLFSNPTQGLSLPSLLAQVGGEEPALLRHVEGLRHLGYDIEYLPHSGYRLSTLPDILVADELQARLPDHPLTRHVLIFKETRSTNDLAHRYGREGHAGPLVIVSESQTHGRGRQGRVWNSQPQLGLWLSLLLKSHIPAHQTPRLTIQSCLALHRAIQKITQIHPEIKWPNDLLFKGRKLAGILTEAQLLGNTLSFVIIGIGCNVNHLASDFPPELQHLATSLFQITGEKIRRADLLVELLQQLATIQTEPWETIRDEWKSHCLSMGKTITLTISGKLITGQMIDIDPNGALIFRHSHGALEAIHAGEILS